MVGKIGFVNYHPGTMPCKACSQEMGAIMYYKNLDNFYCVPCSRRLLKEKEAKVIDEILKLVGDNNAIK